MEAYTPMPHRRRPLSRKRNHKCLWPGEHHEATWRNLALGEPNRPPQPTHRAHRLAQEPGSRRARLVTGRHVSGDAVRANAAPSAPAAASEPRESAARHSARNRSGSCRRGSNRTAKKSIWRGPRRKLEFNYALRNIFLEPEHPLALSPRHHCAQQFDGIYYRHNNIQAGLKRRLAR